MKMLKALGVLLGCLVVRKALRTAEKILVASELCATEQFELWTIPFQAAEAMVLFYSLSAFFAAFLCKMSGVDDD